MIRKLRSASTGFTRERWIRRPAGAAISEPSNRAPLLKNTSAKCSISSGISCIGRSGPQGPRVRSYAGCIAFPGGAIG
jgi:hypothetical protein